MNLKTSKKIFIHVDCDSFFAECEILKNPTLKNKFVIVWEEIVLACNYKTKAFWVKTWMPIWKVRELIWDKWVYLATDHNFYSLVSSKMMHFLKENTLSIEPFSIDEAFCDVTGLAEMNELTLENYILKLQKEVNNFIWVPVSIWVSTTRIKAKIFSKLNKPNGIFIDLWNSKLIYKELKLSIVPFIWPSMQAKLKYNCLNVYDFIKLWFNRLKKDFWINATNIWLELSWVNSYVVKKSPLSKSMSRGRSFNKHITNNKDFLYSQLILNFNFLYEELSFRKFELKKISIFFRDKEKITHLYHYNLPYYTFTRIEILDIIKKLFFTYYDIDMFCRSTGIVFSTLKKTDFHQTNIFEKNSNLEKNNLNLIRAINKINIKFNSHKISFWMDLLNKDFDSKLWIRK